LNHWFEELKKELQSSEVADTIERSEELLFQFDQQREATINASVNTIREGEHLVEQLRYEISNENSSSSFVCWFCKCISFMMHACYVKLSACCPPSKVYCYCHQNRERRCRAFL